MPPSTNEERQHRIDYEIIVDAYDDGEIYIGWYYYFAENLEFPIRAVAHLKKRNGRKENIAIEIVEVASNEEEALKLGIVVPPLDFVFSIDVEDLFSVEASEEDLEILNDWLYWRKKPLL